MNEWLKQVAARAKELWGKWKPIQKVIIIGIVLLVIVAIIFAAKLSSRPATVRLFNSPVTDENARASIVTRLDSENVESWISSDGYISVADQNTARRMREILISENLVPSSIDPWAGYYDRSWSTTDADQNVKLKNTIQKQLIQHIESISEITKADVNIVLPEKQIFAADQEPVTASVIIKTTPTSTLLSDQKRVLGLQRLILSAVEGLKEENLIITDSDGKQVNDFEGMEASTRLDLVAKQQKIIQQQEVRLRAEILKALQRTFSEDRCREMSIRVEMDMSEKVSDSTEITPIVMRADNPDTPYDDSELLQSIPRSIQTVTNEWQGTGYNPEGVAGVEGQNPPTYSDNRNVIGQSTQTGVVQNNEMNSKTTHEVTSPKIDKISVSVNLDGTWVKELDEKGNVKLTESNHIARTYTPISDRDLSEAVRLIEGAIGYDRNRGDRVEVTNIAYYRQDEFDAEDAAYFAAQRRKLIIIIVLISIAVVLISFILIRIISRELERRRREREARLLAEQQAARERALWEAKDEGMEVTMSVEETRRMELQENAIAMAKEHPEDVAMLIRTWLMEE